MIDQHLYFSPSRSMELVELQGLCQHTLQDFNLCMFYDGDLLGDDGDDGSGDPGDPLACLYLDDGIVFKIVCCLICTIHLLEKTSNDQIFTNYSIFFIISFFQLDSC